MPGHMAAQKRQDIRDAITAGMKIEDIRQLLSTSTGSVMKIKREMGIAIRPMRKTRTKGPLKAVTQVVPPPAPTVPLPPEAYVEAFEARVLEFHGLLNNKNIEIERLERELAKIRAEYAQMVFRQQNWQGPTSTINQSLGNGG
jgi:hypothetical protein